MALTWESVGAVLVIDAAGPDGGPTKTRRRRTVEVLAPLRDDLDDLLMPGGRAGRVLVGAKGGPLGYKNWRARTFVPAARRAGVRATPYDGRHTFASLMIHEGRAVMWVAAALGHASATTTLDNYGHMFDEARLGTAQPVVEAIQESRRRRGHTEDDDTRA